MCEICKLDVDWVCSCLCPTVFFDNQKYFWGVYDIEIPTWYLHVMLFVFTLFILSCQNWHVLYLIKKKSENHSGVGTVKLKAAFIISVSSYATEFKHCLIVTYMGKTMMHRLGWVWDVFIYIYEEDNWQICKNSNIRFLQRLYKVDLWFIQLCIMITSIKWSYQFLWPWFMFKVMHAGTQK